MCDADRLRYHSRDDLALAVGPCEILYYYYLLGLGGAMGDRTDGDDDVLHHINAHAHVHVHVHAAQGAGAEASSGGYAHAEVSLHRAPRGGT